MAVRRLLAVAAALASIAGPAAAHRLVIYAYAAAGEIVVEANFDNGNPAKAGEIRVQGADGTLLVTVPLDASGETRLPVPDAGSEGVTVEVETDAGHTDYWILTPADLETPGSEAAQ